MNIKLLTIYSAIIGKNTVKLIESYEQKTDEFIKLIINNFKSRKDYISYFLLYTRTTFLKQEELENERNKFIKCLQVIVNSRELKSVKFKNLDQLINQLSYNNCFYLSYMGKNNRDIFSTYTRYLREICPSLNYNSKYVNVTKLISNIRNDFKNDNKNYNLIRRYNRLRLNRNIKNQVHTLENRKIRVGFISAFLNKNHSVTKDRSGIIMNLPRDKYEVSIFIFDKIDIKPTFRSTREICSISEKLYNNCKNEYVI